jgi:glycosyltransferase involved in cell wall biosynthesis
MKILNDIFKDIHQKEFFDNQFKEIHWNKNVLFINPQLNGRHFYKYLLPYLAMYEYNAWATAITGIDRYKPNKEYESVKVPLNSLQILWADYVVFPFSFDDLSEAYKNLRKINPSINIVYNVDFNYYELSKQHPLHEYFKSGNSIDVIDNIEKNIFNSDLTFTTNTKLTEVVLEKFKELSESKFKDQESYVSIGTLPLFIDTEIIMENIETTIPKLDLEEQKVLRVGIVATNYTWEDLASYKEQFSKVQKELGEKVKFFVFGFDGIDNETKKNCFPADFNCEFIKPCTIVHYYKQLRNLQFDVLFVPLRKNTFNETSENYNKFLEAGMFNVPTMVYDIFPYNQIIKNGDNGILLSKKDDLIERLKFFSENKNELVRMGKNVNKFVIENFNLTEQNVALLDNIYTLNYEFESESEVELEEEK